MKPINNAPLTNGYESHEQVQLLLPWYVNRTLSHKERMLVEMHIQGCDVCRSAQDELQVIAAELRFAPMPASERDASLQHLMLRIGANDCGTKGPGRSGVRELLHNAARRLDAWMTPLPVAFAAALLLLVLAAPLSLRFSADLSSAPGAAYRTLSSGNIMQNTGSSDLNVIFADTLDAEQRMRLLAAVNGEIVGGPSARGVYRVRIAAQTGANEDIAGILSTLRKETGVLFAEPALPQQPLDGEGGKS